MQKAKLDILENIPDIEIALESECAQGVAEAIPVSGGKWAFNKILLLGLPALAIVLVIAGILWLNVSRTSAVAVKAKERLSAATAARNKPAVADKTDKSVAVSQPLKNYSSWFKDFIIDLKDKSGKRKILMFDVVFEVNTEENAIRLENRRDDVRNIIYSTATDKDAIVLRSLEERKRLKNEFLQELNRMLGEGIVQNAYFTNYLIM